jgi:predicted ATP-dependent protease
MKKFPDFVPPTKVAFLERGPTLHLRQCVLGAVESDQEWMFEKDEIRIGSMDDNDVVVRDDTVSRYHCKIVQEDTGYVLVDLRSTNGTFINKVRIREGFLKPGCTIGVGQSQLRSTPARRRCRSCRRAPIAWAGWSAATRGCARCTRSSSASRRPTPPWSSRARPAPARRSWPRPSTTCRRAPPELVVFDCGAVPPNLIESELFGHEKGSFTGAVMTRQGLFELADGGTLFLDELGELPLDLQPKLLRALEQREVRRVGGAKTAKVDVRIIAATNRNLEDEVRAGRFRQDLFYRL